MRDPMTESECSTVIPSQIDQWRHQIRVSTFLHYHREMALALLAKQETDAAIHHLQLALNHLPNSTPLTLQLLDIYESCGKHAEADTLRKSTIAAGGDFDVVNALSIGGKALSLQDWNGVPPIPANASKEAIPSLLVMHEIAALYQLREPVERPTPERVNYEFFSYLDEWKTLLAPALQHYFNSGMWTDTIRLGTIGIKINEDDIKSIHLLGTSLIAAGDAASATKLFEEQTDIWPNNTTLAIDHAIATLNTGDTDRSVEICRDIIVWFRQPLPAVSSLLAWNGLLFNRPELVEEARPLLEAASEMRSPWFCLPLAAMHQVNGEEEVAARMLAEFLSVPEMHQPTRLAMALLPASTIKTRMMSALLSAGFTPDFEKILTPA